MPGVQIGLKDLYYALLTSDVLGSIIYASPVRIVGAITADVNPNASIETLFADDGPMETASTLGQITLDLTAADVPMDMQAVLLGHTIVGGVLLRKGSDIPPWLAIGFRSLKSNGHYRYTWLAKGKFAAPEQKHATKADKVAFQPPTLKGNFVKRDADDVWQKTADEDSTNYIASIGTNWFTSVEGAADLIAPTVLSILPTDVAVAVAVSATFAWTFSEAIMAEDITNKHFFLFLDTTKTQVAGTLSSNAGRTVITFTPAANLTAATKHWTVASTDVRDMSGNYLATPKMSTFTTA